jgi:serine phosphatase RsbU (regulator of sigma subunit)
MQPIELTIGDRAMMPVAFWEAVTGDQVVLLPLVVQNRSIGCLAVSLDSEDTPLRIRSKRLAMLNGIANQATAAIENVRLNTAYQEEAWTSWALLEVSQAINTAESVDAMLEQVVRLAPLLAGVDRCAVMLYDEHAAEFAVVREYSGSAANAGRFEGLRLRLGDLPLLDLAVATLRLQRVDDTSASNLVPDRWARDVGSKSLVIIPLVTQDEVVGALLVDNAETLHTVSQRREDILAGIARQVALALDNFRLQAQEREHLRMTQELQVARRIQTSLLPDSTPQVPGYTVAHTWQAAREVGGDFYDFLPLKKGRWGVLMADVADKGMPAALLMATSLNTIRVAAPLQEEPKRVLSHANQHLHANNRAEMFVTAWYGVLDPTSHLLTYANAGHSLALHIAANGTIQRLRTAGFPLGIRAKLDLSQASLAVAPGDMIVLYTDGITDAVNSSDQEFGEERLQSVLYASRNQPAQAVVDAVTTAVLTHLGQAGLFDDLTLLVLTRNG